MQIINPIRKNSYLKKLFVENTQNLELHQSILCCAKGSSEKPSRSLVS